MENVLSGSFIVQSVEILDGSMLNMTSVVYDPRLKQFLVSVKNIGTVNAYATPELQDLFINGEYLFVTSDQPVLVKVGSTVEIPINREMTEDDISNNQIVKVKVYYGERPQALIKTLYGEFAFKLRSYDWMIYVLIAIILILIALFFFGRKKCPECGTKNSPLARRCRKCHALLRRRKIQKKHEP
jgi:hypothetical protein